MVVSAASWKSGTARCMFVLCGVFYAQMIPKIFFIWLLKLLNAVQSWLTISPLPFLCFSVPIMSVVLRFLT